MNALEKRAVGALLDSLNRLPGTVTYAATLDVHGHVKTIRRLLDAPSTRNRVNRKPVGASVEVGSMPGPSISGRNFFPMREDFRGLPWGMGPEARPLEERGNPKGRRSRAAYAAMLDRACADFRARHPEWFP